MPSSLFLFVFGFQQKYNGVLIDLRIWLSSLITAPKVHPTDRLYLHGFDISSAQYPFSKDIAPTHELHLSTHDMRNRFPPKHRGRYDLVHLRLLVGALKEEDYLQSMRNIFELLSTFLPFSIS